MSKLLLFVFVFSSLGAHALPLPKTMRSMVALPETFTADYNFEGIVALSNCSGSIVRFENSQDTDQAMVLTNGHCNDGGFIQPVEVIINRPSSRGFSVLDPRGGGLGSVHATTIIYGTMTKTDILLYRLRETYAQIMSKY